MTRRNRRVPLLAAAAATVAAVAAVLVGGAAAGVAPPSGDPPLGAALSAEDRIALDAPPVERGDAPAAVDPTVDLTDPEAVARAYLATAHYDGLRRGYRAEVGTATGPPDGAVVVDLLTRYVVLARQPNGRWLVAADSPATPDPPAGED